MAVPAAEPSSKARAAILGVPFDCDNCGPRQSRTGPTAIRKASSMLRPFSPPRRDYDPRQSLQLIDRGDVLIESYAAIEAAHNIEQAALELHQQQQAIVAFGGDGAISLPLLRAAAQVHGPLALLHLDAHTDTYDQPGYDNSTTFTRATEEGLLNPQCIVHLGLRGPTDPVGVYNFAESLGHRLVDMDTLFATGLGACAQQAGELVGSSKVYLCIDVDVFDPATAPGAAMPVWGGLSAREGFALLGGFSGLDIVACDINTTAPPVDPHEQTSFLAARLALECLYLLCER